MRRHFVLAVAMAASLDASHAMAQIAGNEAADRSDQIPPSPPAASFGPAAPTPGGMMIFLDPRTRSPRQPDAADLATFRAQHPQPKASPAPQVRKNPNGGTVAVLDDSFGSYMVATRRRDGSIVAQCLPDAQSASASISAGLNSGEVLVDGRAGVQ
jgi:hypothetical protein